ncbi:MAG: NAD dependent epimerase/dehydratase family [Candidatus Peregrinibacteria bacterium Greene0416_19]|nr:MAG: NAD dependent epimerase/dehydratase family [Candidatus Peregrinibacteria bacterium Greene0416_19]
MTTLVTGSSGTIGTRLVEMMLERKIPVMGIDWMPNKWQPSVHAVTRQCDLRDFQALERLELPADVDTIIHLAANARVYELVEDPDRARDNMMTTYNVLEYARRKGIRRFLFASSREVYGNAGHETYSEDMITVPGCESPYTASKIAGEALMQAYTRCYSMDHIIFRFSNVYGMYDDSNRVIPLFLRLAQNNETLVVFGKEKCLDFTYIDDTVEGVLLGLERFDAVKNGTYNLAYGEGTTILHLAERVKDLTGSTSEIRIASSRRGEVTNYVADISQAKAALGYTPKTSFADGIRRTAEWYGAHT